MLHNVISYLPPGAFEGPGTFTVDDGPATAGSGCATGNKRHKKNPLCKC